MQSYSEDPVEPTIRFPLGQIVATPEALRLLEEHKVNPLLLLARHVQGDWGTVHPDDKAANDEALKCGNRILSSYAIAGAAVVWIITERDRSSTTILCPSEY